MFCYAKLLTHMKCLSDRFSCLLSLLPAFFHDAKSKSTSLDFCIEHRIFESYLFPSKDNAAVIPQFRLDIETLNNRDISMQAIVTELLMLQSKTKVFLVTLSDSGQRVNNNLFKGKTKWLRLRTVLFEVTCIKISLQIGSYRQ